MRSLLIELDTRFRDTGFNRRNDKFHGETYARAEKGRRQSVHLAIYDGGNYIELDSPFIAIRINEVEELVARFEEPHPLLTPSDVRARSTLGFRREPRGFLAVFRKTWKIRNEREAVDVAPKFVSRVMHKANPFWLRFSDHA